MYDLMSKFRRLRRNLERRSRLALRHGATLVELLVVTSIVAILLAFCTMLVSEGVRFAQRLQADANFTKKQIKSASAVHNNSRALTGQYIVMLNDSANPEQVLARLRQQIGLQVTHKYTRVFKGFALQTAASSAPVLLADPEVRYLEMDQTLVLANVSGDLPSTGIRRINVPIPDAQAPGINADIAIIDTGVDLSNQELNVVFRRGFGCSNDANDSDGHGTQVACVAAAKSHRTGAVGVAPGARVWALKVASDGDSGSASNLIAALDFLLSHADEIEVANISVCTTKQSAAVNAAAAACVRAGVAIVAAAGNSRADAASFSPASEPSVITVAALADTDGRLGGYGPRTSAGDSDDTVASFSNFGSVVDFLAPGVQIQTLDLANKPGTVSGTSFAAAHVTGLAARLCDADTLASSAGENGSTAQRVASLLETASKERIPGPGRSQPYPVVSGGAAGAQPAHAGIKRPTGLPLSYEMNLGQTDPSVRFLARAKGCTAFLTPNGLVLANGSAAQRIVFGNANPNPQVIGQSRLPGIANYFIGNNPANWRTSIPTCKEVVYDEIYPGIDVLFRSDQGRVRYDIIVAPGADPAQITLDFPNAERLEVNRGGELYVTFAGKAGSLRQTPPVLFQPGNYGVELVRGRYVAVSQKQVRFEIGNYDRSRELIIDPIIYSTFLGGTSDDEAYSVATDAAGNVYLSGVTNSPNFPKGAPFDGTLNSTDAFVTKMNPTGTALIYSTYLGGTGAEISAYAMFGFGNAIAVDTGGNVLVSSATASTDFPLMSPAQLVNGGGTGDAFLTKLNPTGSALVFSTYLGSTAYEEGRGIALDSLGNVYLVGLVVGAGPFPTTAAAKQKAYAGGAADAFVTKYTPLGAVVYSTLLGGTGDDQACAVTVLGGNVYVTGGASSTDFPITGGVVQPVIGGTYDCFVSQLDAAGSNLVYSTYLGGLATDFGRAIVVDAAGNAYIGVETGSGNFPVTAGVVQGGFAGGTRDGAITKLNPSASVRLYSTYLGGSLTDLIIGLAVDATGNAYVTGPTGSGNFPQFGGLQGFGGIDDAFVTVVNSTGSALLFSTFLGGAGTDHGQAIAFASATDIVAVGWTDSAATFPTTAPLQAIYGGGTADVFITRLTPTISPAGVTVATGSTAVSEAGASAAYTMVLNSAPAANVIITLNPGPELTVFPISITFTPGTWSTPQVITVFAIDDAKIEGPHTGTITHTSVSADPGYNGIFIVSVTVSITDNDSAPPGTLYGITWSAPQLITIDTTTGAGTVVGAVATGSPVGLGFRGNNLYAYGTGGVMREVNPGTGAIMSTIAVPGLPGAGSEGDLAFRSDGLGFIENGGIYSFDLSVPSSKLLNPATDMDGLAFNSAGVLYGLNEGSTQLFLINQVTGAASLIGNTGIPAPVRNFGGLAFDASDNLFAAVSQAGGPSFLYRIDLVTGKATLVGNIGVNEVSGISFSPGVPLGAGVTPPDGGDSSDVATAMGGIGTAKLYKNFDTYRHANGKFDDDWYAWTMNTGGIFTVDLKMTKAVCCGPQGQLAGIGDVHFRIYRVVSGNLMQIAASQTSGTKTLSIPVSQGESILVWAYGLYFTQAQYDITVDVK